MFVISSSHLILNKQSKGPISDGKEANIKIEIMKIKFISILNNTGQFYAMIKLNLSVFFQPHSRRTTPGQFSKECGRHQAKVVTFRTRHQPISTLNVVRE